MAKKNGDKSRPAIDVKVRVSMEKNVSFCLVCAECIGPSRIKNILIPQRKKM